MPGEFTLGETTLGDTLAALAGPPPSANLGASALIDRQNVKARWGERYTSDAVNKKFVGFPRGVYYGFVPSASGLVVSLKPDLSISFTDLSGAPTIGEVITGSTSSATANIRVISSGFFLIDTLDGNFAVNETITGATSGFTAVVTATGADNISFARVTSNTPTVTGRTEHTLDVLTTDVVQIDFTGFVDATYFVYITGSYQVGSTTLATVQSRTTPPPNLVNEILVCKVTKDSSLVPPLSIEATAPVSRQEPFAATNQRIGFMPGGSIEGLLDAINTTQEVVASRERLDGTVDVAFDPGLPDTTGLPSRLRNDLSRESIGNRLGKKLVTMRGNDYAVSAPLSGLINISGSFSGVGRDHRGFKDFSTGDLPTDVPIPLVLEGEGSEDFRLTLSGVSGSFVVGEVITGADSGAKALITTVVSSTVIDTNEFVGVFHIGETINSAGGGAGTLDSIDLKEGAVSAAAGGLSGDTVRNIISVVDTYTGRKPTNTDGLQIYGRLIFGPSVGGAFAGGGQPGEFQTPGGIDVNFVQGSTGVTHSGGGGLDFTRYFQPGDLIEGADGRYYEIDAAAGAVTATTITLVTGKEYRGTNASADARRRLRFQMELFSKSGGVESAETITPGTTIPAGADLRIFFPAWLTTDQSNYDADLELQAPGYGYDQATDTIPGIAFNAPGLGGGSGTGLPVVGAIRTIQDNGATVGNGNFHTINFEQGTISEPSPGVLNVLAVGPQGPPGPGGAGSQGPTGPTGPGFSQIYGYTTQTVPITVVAGPNGNKDFLNFNFGSPMYFYMVNSALGVAQGSIDTGGVTAITGMAGDSSITVEVTFDDAGSPQGQTVIVGAAAAG